MRPERGFQLDIKKKRKIDCRMFTLSLSEMIVVGGNPTQHGV